jgi:DNA-directed RNA polymerase specialized sigma24 family protein
MRALALGLLGPGPDADDAVQDSSLIALRQIGGLAATS